MLSSTKLWSELPKKRWLIITFLAHWTFQLLQPRCLLASAVQCLQCCINTRRWREWNMKSVCSVVSTLANEENEIWKVLAVLYQDSPLKRMKYDKCLQCCMKSHIKRVHSMKYENWVCSMCSMKIGVHWSMNIFFAVCCVKCSFHIVCTVHYTVCTVHYTIYSVHCSLHAVCVVCCSLD